MKMKGEQTMYMYDGVTCMYMYTYMHKLAQQFSKHKRFSCVTIEDHRLDNWWHKEVIHMYLAK